MRLKYKIMNLDVTSVACAGDGGGGAGHRARDVPRHPHGP